MVTGLLVSVNYSDYLKVALPYNTLQFDQIIVLTIESDKECQNLCSEYSSVKCLVFPDEILKKNGKQFNKGAIINKGFEYLNEIGYSDWLVMTDADTVFPKNFKELMVSKEEDLNVLYGMKRKTYTNLKSFVRGREGQYRLDVFMGFCQIFMYQANKFKY
jgi:cellulose synthase/poly-beta-1,6-N-acetylglucosamine synthase-like glycosyltransferase